MTAIRRLLVPGSVFLAQIGNLLIQVLVPRYLVPEEFSRFALSWSYGQFLVVLCFEWMRISVLRFSEGADPALAASRRAVMRRTYLVLSSSLAGIAVVALGSGYIWPFLETLAISAFYTACRGLLDGSQAYARARFLNDQFALTWMLNSVLALALTVLFAWLTGSGLFALLGLALSFLLSLSLHLYKKLFRNTEPRLYDRRQFRFLVSYGSLVAVTASLSAALPPTVRSLAVHGLGHEQSAGVLLALDLSQKVVNAVGLTLNIGLIQHAIRSAETDPQPVLLSKVRRQVALCAALIIPTGVGFALVQSSVAKMFVPDAYRASYLATVFVSSICAAVFSFRSYGVDALFVVAGRSRYSAIGPFTALVTASTWIIVGSRIFGYSPLLISSGLLFGIVVATSVSMLVVRIELPVQWPFVEFLKVAAGCGLMYATTSQIPTTLGILHTPLVVVTGAATYGAFGLATDLCGARTWVAKHLRRDR